MKFVLTVTIKNKKISVNEFRISTILRAKSRDCTNGTERIVPVLITDNICLASKHHTDHMDAITILVIREAQKGEDGIFVSYPDEIEANLLKALSYFHDYGSSKGIAERIR